MSTLTKIKWPSRAGSRQALVGLALLAALNLLNQVDRRALTAIFPLLQAEWGLSDTALGFVVTLSTLGRTLISLPAGWLADRRGALRVLRPAALLWSLAVGASGSAANFGLFALFRGGVGLADGANGPADLAYLGKIFPKHRRATSISIYSAALFAGSAFGVFLGGFVGEHFGWRWVFSILGVIGMLLAIVLRVVPLPAGAVGSTPEPEVDAIAASLSVNQTTKCSRDTPRGYLALMFIGGALGVLATTALVSWAPTYLVRSFDTSLTQAGLLVGGLLLPASIAGTFAGGLLSDRLILARSTSRLKVAAWGLFAGVLPGAAALWAGTLPATLIGFFAAGVCMTLPVSPLLADLQERVHISRQGTAIAVFGLFTQLLGAAPATLLVGWFSDRFGLQLALFVPFLAALSGSLCLWLAQQRIAHTTPDFTPA